MISLRKRQLLIALILACICAPVLGAEPNEVKTGLKFEISSELKPWVRNSQNERGRGPIKPTHVAEFFIRGNYSYPSFSGIEVIKTLLKSSAGRSTTQKQRQFVATSDAFAEMGYGNKVLNYRQFRLYGVSESDAKKMVQAFIQMLTDRANAKREEYLKLRKELEDKIGEVKKNLPEKETEAKAAKGKYNEIKKNPRYFILSDVGAYEKAEETILQMNNMLDTINIEIVGIRAKLETIEKYRADRDENQRVLKVAYDKLDYMFIEQMVELKGSEARKEAVLKIRKQEEEFLNSFDQWTGLERELDRLKDSVSTSERELRGVEERLAKPRPDMLPPKVYQNKVTIYPVRVEE